MLHVTCDMHVQSVRCGAFFSKCAVQESAVSLVAFDSSQMIYRIVTNTAGTCIAQKY